MVHASLKLIGAQLKSHGIPFSLDLAENLPPVLGHPHQIEQVILNLDAIEKRVILEALRRTDNNRAHAARLLSISRASLRRRIARHHL